MNNFKILTSTFVLTVLFALSFGYHRIEFDRYHHYEDMVDYLTQITDEFSNISSLYSIGKSVKSMFITKLIKLMYLATYLKEERDLDPGW